MSHKKDQEVKGDTLVAPDIKVEKPKMFKVILHNDDFTTMECVLEVLQIFFWKNHTEASDLMLRVHHQGSAVGGVYTHEIAETKQEQVIDYARSLGHPLMCSIESE